MNPAFSPMRSTAALFGSRGVASPWLWFAFACLFATAAAHVDAAGRFASIAWDDGAITLGFARTLARHGEIRPSLWSDRVEGYSTPLWMLINAGAYRVIQSPAGLLQFATSASLALNIASLAALFAILRRFAPVEVAGLLAAGWASQTVNFYESVNGMEHPLLVLLLLIAFLGYLDRASPRRYAVYAVASTLAVTVRWEALWFLLPFAINVAREDGLRRLWAPEHLLWAAAFLGLTAFRLAYFGDVLPNTIVAKSNFPYAALDMATAVGSRMGAALDIALLLFPLVALTGLLHACCGANRRWRAAPPPTRPRPTGAFVAALVVAAGLVFNIATGRNFGAPARLFAPALPLAFVCAAACIGRCWAAPSPVVRFGFMAALLVLNVAAVQGAYREMARLDAPAYMPQLTVANVASVVAPIDRIRRRAGREAITVAAPDMGGLTLYGDHLRIVDLGLLCNRDLARTGLEGIEAIAIEREQADIIEAHAFWSAALADAELFYALYRPVIVQGIRFFVRRSLLPRLGAMREEPFGPDGDTPYLDKSHFIHRHYRPHDLAINRRFGTFLVLNE
ncbi:MAG: hypothetical protein IT562_22315 [Alphaproteobacteria bacterium]|nr:hypothetical protein [Alphaproteobacteria bacterium]